MLRSQTNVHASDPSEEELDKIISEKSKTLNNLYEELEKIDSTISEKTDTLNNLKTEIESKQTEYQNILSAIEDYNTKFAGINFGVGFALSFKYGEDRIDSASISGGVVRVDYERNRQPKLMLETHYFFDLKNSDNIGTGPFLGIEPDSSGDSIISTYALGWMVGLKRKNETNASFNIGCAYAVTTNIKTLGDGIKEGLPLPNGETEIRYKEVNQPGWLIMVSFSW